MRRVVLCVAVSVLVSIGFGALGAPGLSDGVSVLLLLSEPYGANTSLWFNQFERLGWAVTIVGLQETIASCSLLCSPIRVDATVDQLPSIDGYDVLVVSTMPGTAAYMPVPAADLRASEAVLDLVRQADAAGLTLFTGCSGLLVFGDAGILAGRDVVCHPTLTGDCASFGASCTSGGQRVLPRTDGQLITGTSGRYYAQEIPEMIARALGANVRFSNEVAIADVDLAQVPLELGAPAAEAWAIGSTRSDGALGVCAVADGFVAVGYTFSGPGGGADLLVLRGDASGRLLWAKAIGGPGLDYGEEVCVASDGGLAIVGHTASTRAGGEDVWLVKLAPDGALEWETTYGGEGPDAGYGIVATSDGGFALCGRTAPGADATSDLCVVKTDAHGNELWSAVVGGTQLDRGHAIVEAPDGRILVAGGTTSRGTGNYDTLLVALSPDGRLLWQQTYGLAQFDVAEDLLVAANGDVLLTGYGDRDATDGNNLLVVRFDASGNRLWADRLGPGRSFDYGESIVELDGGDLLVCGARTSTMTTHNDAWLVRLSPEGAVIWEASLGDPSGNEWASAMCRLRSGQIVVVGHTLSAGAGLHDVLLALIAPDAAP